MKRTFAMLLAIMMLVSCLAGCGPAPSAQPTESQTVPTEPAADILINEVMPDNERVYLGHEKDWVELYNRSDAAVSLDGYYLTDDLQKPQAMPLAGMEIPAGGYLVVTLEEEGPFRLSSNGETVYLVYGKHEISQLTFGISENGEAFSQDGVCDLPTPGYPNTEEGYQSYLESLVLPELTINEILASNSKYMAVGGEYYDLVEVRNNSDQPLSLLGYTLTDKHSEPERYVFPDVTLDPGGFYVVYCSDDASLGDAHAPFKISASGEAVYLAKNGAFVDAMTVPGDLQKNESYGRVGNIPMYLADPTLGQENTEGFSAGVAVPAADLPSGIYPEAVTVTLSGEGTIYYTTDGSRPTTKSKVYSEPLTLDGVTTVRTFCVSGERSSAVTAYTYAVGIQHDLPVVHVVTPQKNLTGANGLQVSVYSEEEYEANVTLIEDGEEKFSVPFGLCLHGHDSRKADKQTYQLRFRSEYGVSTLNYPLFDSREFEEYDSLLLKGGSELWYAAMLQDELATAMVDGTTELYVQASKPVVLYMNGQYWGIYFFRERFNDDYVASHLNVSPESVDLLRSMSASVQAGSNEEYKALREYTKKNDMSLPENYQYLTEKIDVVSLMDWYICRSFMGDKDIGNIRRFRSSEADGGKWKWMFFDMDWAFHHVTDEPLTSIVERNSADYLLIQAVLASEEGRDAFLKRYDYLMDTILNEAYLNATLDKIIEPILSEIPADRARWGVTVERWEKGVQRLRDYDAGGSRRANVLKDLQKYFDLTDAQMESYFG